MSDLTPEALAEWREFYTPAAVALPGTPGHSSACRILALLDALAAEKARAEQAEAAAAEADDAADAQAFRAEQAEHTAGQLRTALTESRSVWKARAEQAEEDARIERLSSAAHARMADDLAGQLEQAERERDIYKETSGEWREDAQQAERALSDLRAAVKALPRWAVPPGYTGETGAFVTGEARPALVVRWADLDRLVAEHRAETDADNACGDWPAPCNHDPAHGTDADNGGGEGQ